MTEKALANTLYLPSDNNQRLFNLYGQYDNNIKYLERQLGITIQIRGSSFLFGGEQQQIAIACKALKNLYNLTAQKELTEEDIHLTLQYMNNIHHDNTRNSKHSKHITIRTKLKSITTKGFNQACFIENIRTECINFGVGPAGTGKTFLAVACAVEALLQDTIERIILVRPAVEAGEKLGFLPGDLSQKIDPYLKPLYDALYELMGSEYVLRLIEKQIIEVAPLAYMRGRTLNNAFIILDESQNTTPEQMKMFLTRIGFNSKAVITGDLSQIDLPGNKSSGLKHAINILRDLKNIKINYFTSHDVIRHPIIKAIVDAYDKYEMAQKKVEPSK